MEDKTWKELRERALNHPIAKVASEHGEMTLGELCDRLAALEKWGREVVRELRCTCLKITAEVNSEPIEIKVGKCMSCMLVIEARTLGLVED